MSTLSNMSSYFYKEQKLVSYTKSTYCNEVKNLNIDGTQDYYLYNFGYWISTIQNDSFLSYTLHSNCTTAICRDVFSNSIIHKIQKRYIIVQSDYININECKNNIKLHTIIIHADSYNSCVYKNLNCNLIPMETVLECNIHIKNKICSCKIFMLG